MGLKIMERQSRMCSAARLMGLKYCNVEAAAHTPGYQINGRCDWVIPILAFIICSARRSMVHPYPTMVRDFKA